MTDQQRRFAQFAALHKPGTPLLLFNVWDPGSARAVAEAGAPAIATGSWSVAAAFGLDDGEALPLELALANAARIVGAVALPVTIDFEAGYAADPEGLAANVRALLETGCVGCNLEDQIIGGHGLQTIKDQCLRIEAAREAVGPGFFINARTDLFLKSPRVDHRDSVGQALERAHAYAEAGASGFFIPGLVDPDSIGRICEGVRLPVNVMATPGAPGADVLASVGVARISQGPGPYRMVMAVLKEAAAAQYR
jgi:2-methylisocitrate lyase-like PEP mutase family enzyme